MRPSQSTWSAKATQRRHPAPDADDPYRVGPVPLRGWDLRPIPANDNAANLFTDFLNRASRLAQKHWPLTGAAACATALALTLLG